MKSVNDIVTIVVIEEIIQENLKISFSLDKLGIFVIEIKEIFIVSILFRAVVIQARIKAKIE